MQFRWKYCWLRSTSTRQFFFVLFLLSFSGSLAICDDIRNLYYNVRVDIKRNYCLLSARRADNLRSGAGQHSFTSKFYFYISAISTKRLAICWAAEALLCVDIWNEILLMFESESKRLSYPYVQRRTVTTATTTKGRHSKTFLFSQSPASGARIFIWKQSWNVARQQNEWHLSKRRIEQKVMVLVLVISLQVSIDLRVEFTSMSRNFNYLPPVIPIPSRIRSKEQWNQQHLDPLGKIGANHSHTLSLMTSRGKQ